MQKVESVIFYQGVRMAKSVHQSLSITNNKSSDGREIQLVSIEEVPNGVKVSMGGDTLLIPFNNIVCIKYVEEKKPEEVKDSKDEKASELKSKKAQ